VLIFIPWRRLIGDVTGPTTTDTDIAAPAWLPLEVPSRGVPFEVNDPSMLIKWSIARPLPPAAPSSVTTVAGMPPE